MLSKELIEKRIKDSQEPWWLKEKRLKALSAIENNLEIFSENVDISSYNFWPEEWPALSSMPPEAMTMFPSGSHHIQGTAIFFDSSLVYKHDANKLVQELAHTPPALRLSNGHYEPWEALNMCCFHNGLLVNVPAGFKTTPFYSLWWSATNKSASFPRHLIHAGKNSEVIFVEEMAAPKELEPGIVCSVTEIIAEEGARVHYIRIIRPENSQRHIGVLKARLDKGAGFNFTSLELTNGHSNLTAKVTLAGEGAGSTMASAIMGYGNGLVSYDISYEHAAPSTTSNILYKSASFDRAKSKYRGIVKIEKEATLANSCQTSKNLLLSKEAKADSVPVLEIKTNDVKASHGSTTSSINEDERFYIESRGIPKSEAGKLIVEGFLAEVLNKINETGLENRLTAILGKRLEERN